MEAATVARLAKARGLPFRTLRAISDAVDDNLPDLSRFTDERGGFPSASFAVYVALHPWLIPALSGWESGLRTGIGRQCDQHYVQVLRQAE